jgi:hypothetical protein
MDVKRLVREFTVNSKGDLNDYIAEHPEYAVRYMDVGLRYLPPATAFALRDVMAVLAPANRRVSVTPVSELQPASLKSADIVYIGYLSGLGMLQDLFFTGSRFALGESDDEVIDRNTKHSYVSETFDQIMGPPQPTGTQTSYHDYGVVAKFRGPGGNTIVVISGTRDAGVRQSAEAFTTSEKLEELGRQVDTTQPIEALLEVRAFDGVNLAGKLLLESKRDATSAK